MKTTQSEYEVQATANYMRQRGVGHVDHDLTVRLSKFHDGQIVTPVVSARIRAGVLKVDLYWYDASDQTRIRPATFSVAHCGPEARREATEWLRGHGVSVDNL